MTTFTIDGMHCEGCAARLDKLLRRVPGVTLVRVSFASHSADVDGTPTSAEVVQAIEKAGFKAEPASGAGSTGV